MIQKIVCDVLVFWDAMCWFYGMCWFSGMLWSFVTSLPIPNEDVGRPSKHSGTHFQSNFQNKVAQIEYSRMWKVLWKYVPECFLGLPKSSFGEHKMSVRSYKIIVGRAITLHRRTFVRYPHDSCCCYVRCAQPRQIIVANKKVALSPLGRNEYEKRR